MDAYRTLRQHAATKRDISIAEARRVYRKDIASIEAPERRVPSQDPPVPPGVSLKKPPNTVALIKSLIPADKPFTISEVMHWLHAATGGKKFNEPTIRTYVSRLHAQGALRKLYKTGGNYSLWIAAESPIQDGPIETRSLPEVVEQVVLEDGPLRPVEIVVGIRSRGYRENACPRTLARAVRDALKRYRGRFVCGEDGRWGVVVN